MSTRKFQAVITDVERLERAIIRLTDQMFLGNRKEAAEARALLAQLADATRLIADEVLGRAA
jgi:PHD/YefM family antitoxin component YafN of YafNO toxin-antitoxin module